MAGHITYDLFKYYCNDYLMDIDYCLYKAFYQAMSHNQAIQLTDLFDKRLELDVVILQRNEIGEIEQCSRSVNREADVTPIDKINELSSSPSTYFLNEFTSSKIQEVLPFSLSKDCMTLLEFQHLLIKMNCLLQEYNLSFFGIDPLAEELIPQSVNEEIFVNSSLTFLLHQLLQNSCVVLGQLVPDWLHALVIYTPQLFSFQDRVSFMFLSFIHLFTYRNSYAFDPMTSYMALYDRKEWQNLRILQNIQPVLSFFLLSYLVNQTGC